MEFVSRAPLSVSQSFCLDPLESFGRRVRPLKRVAPSARRPPGGRIEIRKRDFGLPVRQADPPTFD